MFNERREKVKRSLPFMSAYPEDGKLSIGYDGITITNKHKDKVVVTFMQKNIPVFDFVFNAGRDEVYTLDMTEMEGNIKLKMSAVV